MSRSQPGSARASTAQGQAPDFASQPGSATAAAAASFAAPPELASPGGSGPGAPGAPEGAAMYAQEGAAPAGYDPQGAAAGAAAAGGYDAEGAAAAGYDPEGAAAAGYDAGGGAAYNAEGGTATAGAYGAADAAAFYGGAAAQADPYSTAAQQHYGSSSEQDAAAVQAAAEGAAAGADGYSPLAYLQQLEAHLGMLQAQRQGVEQQLAAAAATAYQHMSQRLGTASTGVPLPPDVPALVDELAVLQSVRQYLAYLQELQALSRHAEKAVRALQQQQQQQQAEGAAAEAGSAAAFLQAVAEAVDGFSNAVGYAIAVKQLTEQGKVPVPRLQRHAEALLLRVDGVQRGLRSVLSAAIQRQLSAAHWPPPLTEVSGDGGAAAAAAAGAGAGAGGWRGFAAAGEAAVGELQQLLVLLLTLQRASQHEQFSTLSEASQEGPLLWAAEELAKPLAERLRHHFASGLPTDRPDRPEWLFATALKAAQQCCPLAQELQPCVEAHQLQAWYSLPLELACAIQADGVNAIISDHLLPQLVGAADPSLWLHLADEAMAFEKRFAPLRGASLALPEEEEFLGAAHPGSTIELLFQRPEWQEGWLGAELWDAARQLETACDAYSAWQPAAEQLLAVAGQEADMVPDTPRSRGGAAWRREFWPPVCAEQVAALVAGLVRRGGWVHRQEHKLLYAQAVPIAILKAFRERLSGLLQQAEQFRGVLGDVWLPRVGAAICAAHHLEHQLREPQGVLLLAELQDAAAAGTAGAAGTAPESAAAAAAAGPAPAAAKAGRSQAALLEREAAAYGSLRRQWAYKLAKLAVDRFHQLFAPYKRNAAAFTAGWEEGVPPEQQAAAAAAAGPPAPSPAMLLAADSLQQLLRALAQHLDAVVFRDVWKSVALAVNYSLYNEVATEALFSPQGAAQLDADLSAVSSIFGEYTSRPAAHFKESREACRLLGLPCRAALGLLGQLESAPREAKRVLAPHGVKSLNAEQVGVVLCQRLDVLAARAGGGAAAAAAAAQAVAAANAEQTAQGAPAAAAVPV
ncbi:hypothetical protein ABPG75_012567 [Micractinium tetrahymenae]